MKLAQESGEPVEVVERTTETSQVTANPDGRFTLRSNTRPVRTRKDGQWRAVDVDLVRGQDGLVRPEASTMDVAFSGGGTGPAITVLEGAAKVDMFWPNALPSPRVAGNVATYPDVLPGVDLALSAHGDGFSQVLVVHNAQAAANPALRSIKLSAVTAGVTLVGEANGSISAVDVAGTPVLAGTTPVMWDSTRGDYASAPDVNDSRGGQVSKVDVTATPRAEGGPQARAMAETTETGGVTDITITPNQAALTGADVVYPVFIDPSLSRYKTQWLQVTTANWTHYNTADQAGVGFCDNWIGCGGSWTSRAFFRMDIAELNTRNNLDPTIFAAKFYVIQTHSVRNDCVPEPVDLRRAYWGFNSGTTWPGPETAWAGQTSSAAGDKCGGAGTISFDVVDSIRAGVEAATNWTEINFGLRSPNEGNRNQWKRFDNNPQLVVDFTYPPNSPNSFDVNNAVKCDGKVITPEKRPTVSAVATDNNIPALDLNLWMDIVNSAGTQVASMAGSSAPVIASGTRGYWTVPVDLQEGDHGVRAMAENRYPGPAGGHNLGSPLAGPSSFTVNSVQPPKPEISSLDYPVDYWGATQNAPGTMTVTGTGAVGAVYSFDGALPLQPQPQDCNYTRAPVNGSGWAVMNQGKGTFALPTNLTPGYHTVKVRTFSNAHKLSPESDAYRFYVAPQAGTSTQRLQPETLSPTQPTGQGISISTQPNCCDVAWSGGSQLRFGGTAINQSFTLDVKTTVSGDYDLAAVVTRSSDYAQIKFALDGQAVGPTSYDAYSLYVATDLVPLGRHRLTANVARKLTITTVGTNANTILTRHVVGIDEIVLTPSGRVETELPMAVASASLKAENHPRWSLGSHLAYEGSASDPTFSVKFTIGDTQEGDYALALGLTRANGYGRMTVRLDGEPLRSTDTAPIDVSLPLAMPDPVVLHEPLGGAHLTKGEHILEFQLADKYRAGIDYLSVTKLTGAVETSFAAARNNNGVTAAAATDGNLDIINNSLSAETLAAAGLGSASTVAIGGATFTLPTWSDTNDNVISTGQTIPFDVGQKVKASAVGMLVTATCGATPTAQAKITYAETSGSSSTARFSTPLVPVVGDWAGGADGQQATVLDRDTAVMLPYRYNKGAIDNAVRPRVYAIFLPADPNLTLDRITLPHYGFMPGVECQPSLHVFAIAPVPVQPTVWVGGWQAPADAAVAPPVAGGFANKTLRTVIHPNTTGGSVRVRLANPHTTASVAISAATIGKRTTGSDVSAPTPLTFKAATTITIPAGGEVTSDSVTWPAGATDLVVSIHVPNAVALAPHHRSTTATTLVASGNQTTATTLTTPTTVSGTYFVAALDISNTSTPDDTTGTVVVLGDQTSGVAPTTSGTTWVERITGNLVGTQGLTNASRVGHTLGHWKLNRDQLDYAGATNLTSGTAPFITDAQRGTVASFGGSTVLATAGPVIDTQRSYSVAAWVKLTTNAYYYTAVSQGGVNAAAFYLQYNKALNKWAFVSPSSDSGSAASYPAATGPAPTLNTWTHLVGTYDHATGTMSLYVNGALAGTAINTTPFTTNGPLGVGGVKLAGGQTNNQFIGSLTDAWAFNRTITADEARQLSLGSPTQLTAPTTADALDELNRTTYNTPRLQSVILALGANDLLDSSSTNANEIKNQLRGRLIELALTHPSSLTNRTAPNGALIRMHLTTIPPLGLSPTDPREQARRAINDDIRLNYSDYHADQIIDIATTVQDPTNPHQTRATYLTNNKPNDAYHNAITTAFNPATGPIRF